MSNGYNRVFLGGTCNESKWRDELIAQLLPGVDYFNPVVEDWTQECMAEEIRQRQTCDYVLYVITPKMTGVYAIAEAVDDSNKRPEKTIFCLLDTDGEDSFSEGQRRSLQQVKEMIQDNGAMVAISLHAVASWLNTL